MIMKMNWTPSRTELRKFGAVIILGFGLIGAVAYGRGRITSAQWIWSISSAIGVWSILFPSLAKPFYWAWMGFGNVMGSIVSPIVLAAIFYGIVTPIAFLFRRLSRDPLRLNRKTITGDSYWLEHPEIKDKKSYEHLF